MKNFSFYLARHGETELNRQNKCVGGRTNISLNKNGINQAIDLGKKLSDLSFSKIISSPLKRCIETAKYAGIKNYEINNNLEEWKIGIFETVDLRYFLKMREILNDNDSLPDGESKKDYFTRVSSVIKDIINNNENNFLIIAHGGTYWALLNAFNLDYDHLENCGLVKFTCNANQYKTELFPQ